MEFPNDINILLDIIKKAGDEVMKIYETDFTHETKADNSPLTQADLNSEKVLIEELKINFPDHGIISEERENDLDVYNKRFIWVIDPLDGTKDFVQKTGEFSVMVALLEDCVPIMSAVYAPVIDKLYFAKKGFGSYLEINNGKIERLSISDIIDMKSARLVRSRNHFNEFDQKLCENLEIKNFIMMGSVGVKFGAIAEGVAELCYYTTDKMGIWDDAAAHIILKEAGGAVFDMDGNEPEYDLEGRKMKNGFIGTNGKIDKNLIIDSIKNNF